MTALAIAYAFVAGLATGYLLTDGEGTAAARILSVVVGIIWPLWPLASTAEKLIGERSERHCRTCRHDATARWAWLRAVLWLLHAGRSPGCREGRSMREWWWSFILFQATGRRLWPVPDPPTPYPKAPSFRDPPTAPRDTE